MLIKLLSIYLFAGVMLLSSMFVNSYIKGKSSYAKTLGALCLSLQIYLLGYLMEINTDSIENMMFWNQIQYIGIPFFPTLWLLVSMQYTGRGNSLKKMRGLLLFVIPIITFVIRVTNGTHHLYYRKIELKNVVGNELLFLTKGPWYFVQMAYVLLTLVLCSWFYFIRYKKSAGDERIQFRILLTASILPYIALVLVSTNLGGFGIDYTAIILPPCIFIIHMALTRYNFLEIKLLARERVFEESAAGLLLLNRYDQIVDYNHKSRLFLGWFGITVKEERLEGLLLQQEQLLQCIKNREEKIICIQVNEEMHFIDTNVRKIMNKEEAVGFLVTLTDVTEREVLKMQLLEMASVDELSGLFNRRKLRDAGKEAFLRAKRYQEKLTVLMMDIDYFKKVNDTYGHQIGDEVIKEFSKVLSQIFRDTDIVGRMGGEEFAAIMINAELDLGYQKAELFRKAIEARKMIFGEHTVRITVSIGIAELDKETQTLDSIVNHADDALYEAKRSGRNKTIAYR